MMSIIPPMKTRPVSNPPNPWAGGHAEYLEVPPAAELKVFLERAGSILSENRSPDLGFRFSLNPYRGCYHGCAYCYARPTHAYLDFGAGTDFDRKIIVKINAATKLREAFLKPSWQGEMVVFSGNTDCYQPLEASYGLTRRCLEVCHEFRNPVGIITKAALIRRDIDLLQQLHRKARRLVEDEDVPVLVDHHRVEQAAFLGGKRFDIGLGRIGGALVEGQRRHADFLVRLQPGVGLDAACTHAHLAGAGQLVEIGEGHLREMHLEPAVEAHPRFLGGDDVAFDFTHCARARTR